MHEKLENFLLYALEDDWGPLGEFDAAVATITPAEYSREHVLEVVAELAERGHVRLGSFPGGGRAWEPWDLPVEAAIRKIAEGYDNQPGYLALSQSEIGASEVFRAEITRRGMDRLHELGDPYERFGDPWFNDPLLRAEES